MKLEVPAPLRVVRAGFDGHDALAEDETQAELHTPPRQNS